MRLARAATVADVMDLHALVESAYRGDSARRGWTHEADLLDGQRTDPDMLLASIADPRQTILLAEEDGELVGCVLIEGRDDHGYVGMVTVDPSRQAAGLGRWLLEQAETLVSRSFGFDRARMTVIAQRTELIAWYGRRGYEDTGERSDFPYGDARFGKPRQDDLVFVILEKSLPSEA
ncbi:GNAT family N-acetyltransferase [Sphingomonas lacunae]|uniref:GNAT family N-acetyltransferase n=1 Tax=Sphingomonas lacunae TaxID=2698828 RepID=A0A6M4AU56_9SPHN|nr:GNAT family N-acetyltransferase [Sphingomonas lacunae]QJQ32658.1 GNAT family N-acetyltransferase [Sphingomonas lacunae]